jgi:hypothetical protein
LTSVRLTRRLTRLEERAAATPPLLQTEQEAHRREVLRRMTNEELRVYVAALRRAKEAGGVFDEGDRPILERAAELYAEVGGP